MLAGEPRNRGNLLENYIQTGSRGLDRLYPDITRDLEQTLTRLPQSMSMARARQAGLGISSSTSFARHGLLRL